MVEIRLLGPDDFDAAYGVSLIALQQAGYTAAEREERAPWWMAARSFGASLDGAMVGHVRAFVTDTVVPGGARVPTGAVTSVGVLPTHRRRGVLSALMARQLDDMAASGQILASLRASEAPIYGRYGYGVAGDYVDFEIERSATAFAKPMPSIGGRVRMVPPAEVGALCHDIYDRSRRRPGSIARTEFLWWRIGAAVTSGTKPVWCAVHEDAAGVADGYVWYEAMASGIPIGQPLRVDELWAADDDVAAVLWRFVLDVDLAGSFVLKRRPSDDPLRWLLADPRALRVTRREDEQWVRLIDVGACLAARTYNPTSAEVTIAVADDRLPRNTGTYRVAADGAGRSRTKRPDLSADVSALGATYLGGTSWAELAAAGQVTEHRAGALRDADALFAHRPLPWCGTFF